MTVLQTDIDRIREKIGRLPFEAHVKREFSDALPGLSPDQLAQFEQSADLCISALLALNDADQPNTAAQQPEVSSAVVQSEMSAPQQQSRLSGWPAIASKDGVRGVSVESLRADIKNEAVENETLKQRLLRYADHLENAYPKIGTKTLLSEIKAVSDGLLKKIDLRKQMAIETADDLLSRALAWNPRSAEHMFLWGTCRVANSDYATAKLIFTEVLRRHPQNLHVAERFALFLSDRCGEHRLALSMMRDVFSRIPREKSDKNAHATLFYLLFKVGLETGDGEELARDLNVFLREHGTKDCNTTLLLFADFYSPDPKLPAFLDRMFANVTVSADWLHSFIPSTYGLCDDNAGKYLRAAVQGHSRRTQDGPPRADASDWKPDNERRKFSQRTKEISNGRGFQFTREHEVAKTAKLEPLSPNLEMMGKLNELYLRGDFSAINEFLASNRVSETSEAVQTYAKVLAIRGGNLTFPVDERTFSVAFELALGRRNVETLKRLAKLHEKFDALCLVARSALGDEAAFDEIAQALRQPAHQSGLRDDRIRDLAQQIEPDKSADFLITLERREYIVAVLSDINRASIQ